MFVVAQLVGATAAACFVRATYPSALRSSRAAVAALAPGVSTIDGLLVEGVLTFVLVWVVFAVAVDRDGTWFRVAGLPIGLAVSMLILMGGMVTGAPMNPARAFGPALAYRAWSDQWVYWVAPVVGGALAGLAYMGLARPRVHGAPQPR